MGKLVPNETIIDFNELHQDDRAYAKEVIQYTLPICDPFLQMVIGIGVLFKGSGLVNLFQMIA